MISQSKKVLFLVFIFFNGIINSESILIQNATIYDGKKVAVLGRPNAGKSTFIKNLIDQDRLIVSEIAGTTIDSIQIPFEFNNEKFIFIDTAGIRKGYKYHHKVEYFSYVRTLHSIDQSNVVIFIIIFLNYFF